ncbi:MAG: mechanosensitive ion channel family protein [Bacilli bacterium]|nr:mechanosensitive ion channel family protein [Bacilli bacterium]
MKERTKKQTIKVAIILGLMILITIAIMIYQDYLTANDSIFYITDAKNPVINAIWKKIPALIISFQIISVSALAIFLMNLILSKLFQKTNRQKTVMSLMRSMIKWVIIIITILLVLNAFGVDTSTLLASAGILALIIGLGAQSLIADIIAGFFIVFEEEYQVGDIITIDGFRGTVADIGIRVTKIIDAGGNIKIVNNSDIKSIINQTSELSVAKCVMSIDYDESVERVEVVFKKNLEKIKKNIPGIVEGPIYKGINQLNTSSVDLFFIAKCKEEDVYQVQRDLNRELYLMFKDNDITVPFTQVVVSDRNEEKKVASAEIKNEAKQFVDLQKGITPQDKKPENKK